ncbi:MAG: hypothetical protein AAFQ82_23215, partial [Myxococcota bacterium]
GPAQCRLDTVVLGCQPTEEPCPLDATAVVHEKTGACGIAPTACAPAGWRIDDTSGCGEPLPPPPKCEWLSVERCEDSVALGCDALFCLNYRNATDCEDDPECSPQFEGVVDEDRMCVGESEFWVCVPSEYRNSRACSTAFVVTYDPVTDRCGLTGGCSVWSSANGTRCQSKDIPPFCAEPNSFGGPDLASPRSRSSTQL